MVVTTFDIRVLDELFGPARSATLESLKARLRALDDDLWMHAGLVSEHSMRIAAMLNLAEIDRDALNAAAWLHDIGKLTIARSILDKPGLLDVAEWSEIQQHPKRAAEYLMEARELRAAAPIVLHHHERFDGAGYPNGLVGKTIPLGARILCVADSFDAITADRPYRTARTALNALNEVKRCSGTQFDPVVVEALVSIGHRPTMELEH